MPHLAIFSRHAGSVDDSAAFAIFHRVKRQHARSRFGNTAECADQIDLNDEIERFEREMLDRTIGFGPACCLDGIAGACAINQNAFLPMGGARLCETGIHRCIIRDIHFAENAANIFGNLFAFFFLQIENRDLGALGSQRPRRCFAKARCAACNHGGRIAIDIHK